MVQMMMLMLMLMRMLMLLFCGNLELGAWNLQLGAWSLELGAWNLQLGIWNLELGAWNLELCMEASLCYFRSRFRCRLKYNGSGDGPGSLPPQTGQIRKKHSRDHFLLLFAVFSAENAL